MTTIKVLVGIPGSGKDYFINERKKPTDVVLSSDSIRGELFGDENCQDDNGKVFQDLYKKMIQAINNGADVIWINATNINRKNRRILFEKLRCNKLTNMVKVEAHVLATPVDVCVDRDCKRERSVGKNVIWKFVHRFEYPQYFEGYDSIVCWFTQESDLGAVRNDVERMHGFDQKNPWHKLDLWEHTQRVMGLVPEEMRLAAFCHDIGKLYTQVFVDDVAHYYRHENVSAYYTMCYWNEIREISGLSGGFMETIFLVNYHMLGHQIKDMDKWKEKFGGLYDKLMQFCEADSKGKGK